MENSKLMTTLFYNGNFNREGRRMRVVLEKEISDGMRTYRLWRSAGKPDVEYPRAENDKYVLRVEINGYLAPLGMTDFNLVDVCGFELAAQKLYGGREKRGAWIDALRESGGSDAVSAAVAEEQSEIERYGGDPVRQTAYIQNLLDGHVSTYLKARENGGQTFPDFMGALVLNDLARCMELSAVYRAKRQAENEARQVRIAEEEKVYCAEQNKQVEQAISAAIEVIRNGGVLRNEAIKIYHSRYSVSSYFIVNHLMRQYQVDVPLRTQGWINGKLSSATIRDGRCVNLQFLHTKNGRVSQKFCECMNALIRTVAEQAKGTDAA
ncbi:hypothetical protein AALA83_15175 [Oscillospiraceae bacterium 44-5]